MTQVSTGISELDQRLGGLSPGRYYLLTGTPGAGKTSACLHFLAEGLRAGERAALLTQENPDDLFAHAQFLGCDIRDAVASGQLAVLQFRLDFSTNYARVANPRVVAQELVGMIGDERPQRLVVDSILPFVQAGGVSTGAVLALLHAMDELRATAYFTVPGDLGDSFYARLYDPLVSGSAGVLHFEMCDGDVRQVVIRKVRQTPASTAPLRFFIRAGLGIVEIDDAARVARREEPNKRVALINQGGRVGGELFASLSNEYELATFTSVDEARSSIDDDFDVVLIAVDPLDPGAAISFVRSIRRQSGVPIVLAAEGEGLRSVTRSRALRAGADDFITIDSAPQEVMSRVEAARRRGPRDSADRYKRETVVVQPRDTNNQVLALPEAEIARAAQHHLENSEYPFFALVRVRPPRDMIPLAWQTLTQRLRLRDGDLIGPSNRTGELLVYLPDISRRHARELLERVFSADPRLESTESVIDHYPADTGRIEAWLKVAEHPDELLAAG